MILPLYESTLSCKLFFGGGRPLLASENPSVIEMDISVYRVVNQWVDSQHYLVLGSGKEEIIRGMNLVFLIAVLYWILGSGKLNPFHGGFRLITWLSSEKWF